MLCCGCTAWWPVGAVNPWHTCGFLNVYPCPSDSHHVPLAVGIVQRDFSKPRLCCCAGMLNDLSDLNAAGGGGGGGGAGSVNSSEALAMRYNDPVLETLALQRLKELAPLVRGTLPGCP
jgi:hypothetical protein